ncbi:MAG: serine/threonine-protein kinase [Myxococcota bacterium]
MADEPRDPALESAKRRLGQVVDSKYKLLSVMGIGGMGIVYEAEHQFLGRRVALKILHPRYLDRLEEFQRFLREARAVGAIGHRTIVEVFDAGFLDGTTPYLVMERLVGENLEEYIKRRNTLSAKRTFRIAYEVLRGLAVAHAKNILHCDMKPANVFIVRTQGKRTGVKLLDFGISKLAVGGRAHAVDEPTGFVFGTPFYMAPEQVVGGEVEPRTDVYAVGAIVYEALMGRPPFTAPTRREVFKKILRSKPDPLHPPRGDLPTFLSDLVLRMLAKDPNDRPTCAAEVNQALVDCGAVHLRVYTNEDVTSDGEDL